MPSCRPDYEIYLLFQRQRIYNLSDRAGPIHFFSGSIVGAAGCKIQGGRKNDVQEIKGNVFHFMDFSVVIMLFLEDFRIVCFPECVCTFEYHAAPVVCQIIPCFIFHTANQHSVYQIVCGVRSAGITVFSLARAIRMAF